MCGEKHAYIMYTTINVSSVVAFQRWWVLKSKLFAQESKEMLISTFSIALMYPGKPKKFKWSRINILQGFTVYNFADFLFKLVPFTF